MFLRAVVEVKADGTALLKDTKRTIDVPSSAG